MNPKGNLLDRIRNLAATTFVRRTYPKAKIVMQANVYREFTTYTLYHHRQRGDHVLLVPFLCFAVFNDGHRKELT